MLNPFGKNSVQKQMLFIALAVSVCALLIIHHNIYRFDVFPPTWNLQLREPIDEFQVWVITNRNTHAMFIYFFEPLSDAIDYALQQIELALLWLPWQVIILGAFLLAKKVSNWQSAFLITTCALFMGLMGLWDESMQTLALMLLSVAVSLSIGIPLGILMAFSRKLETILRPILDAMQTLPAFVYLIPVLLFFGVAGVPSVVATLIYALPPCVRLTSLGIRQVPTETLEAAQSFGATPFQILYKIRLPIALPMIMAGINQTIMMALSIVVIAALIGANGLGRNVLFALRRLRVGEAFEGGLAIVVMAILLDRLSDAFVQRGYRASRSPTYSLYNRYKHALPSFFIDNAAGKKLLTILFSAYGYVMGSILLLAGLTGVFHHTGQTEFPANLYIPLRDPVDAAVDWAQVNLYEIEGTSWGTGAFSDFITLKLLSPLRKLLQETIPWPAMILLVIVPTYGVAGGRLALMCGAGLLLIGALGMWAHAMDTLSQVIVAVILAVAIGLPLGIWAGRSDLIEQALRPLLDFLQTIPPFVYLVPVIMLFNLGRVPGILASVLYALPPVIRLTSLGIRQLNTATVEAAKSFGSTHFQMLRKVEIPLAIPTIMMGINQTIMMVLAMVVIAGLVGGGGLGFEVVSGLAQNELGRGVEAGIAIVLMGIILDRLTQSWITYQEKSKHLRV